MMERKKLFNDDTKNVLICSQEKVKEEEEKEKELRECKSQTVLVRQEEAFKFVRQVPIEILIAVQLKLKWHNFEFSDSTIFSILSETMQLSITHEQQYNN